MRRARDSAALRIIGGFFTVFSCLVFLGGFYESWEARAHAVVINFVAAIVLLAVGVTLFLIGTHLRRP